MLFCSQAMANIPRSVLVQTICGHRNVRGVFDGFPPPGDQFFPLLESGYSSLMARYWGSRVFAPVVIAGGLSVIFLTRAGWDPDPHHDGVMYTAAIGVREGFLPNRDVFAQYGPLVPTIQGLWLKSFGPELLNLRILNSFLLIAIGLLAFRLIRKRLGSLTAGLLVITWALINPRPCQHSCSIFAISNNLPWSSVFSTFIIMLTLSLINSIDLPEVKSPKRGLLFGLSGFFLVVGGFARIQLFASFLVVGIALFWKRELFRSRTEEYSFLLGGLIAGSISVILLVELGIWRPFLNQSVFWSFHTYGRNSVGVSTLIDILWYPAIALMLLILWIITSNAIHATNQAIRGVLLFIPTAVFFIAVLILNSNDGNSSVVNGSSFPQDLSSNLISGLGYISVAYFLFQLLPLSTRGSLDKVSTIESRPKRTLCQLAGFGIALTTLIQLYPLFDPLHLWWITPVLISVIFGNSSREPKPTPSNQSIGRSILIGLAVTNLLQLTMATQIHRVSFADPALRGMKAPIAKVRALDATLNMLEKFGIPRQIKFFCSDGLFAAAGGKYMAAGADFVDWASVSPKDEQIGYKQVFICNVRKSSIQDFQQIGWVMIAKTSSEDGLGINALFKK